MTLLLVGCPSGGKPSPRSEAKADAKQQPATKSEPAPKEKPDDAKAPPPDAKPADAKPATGAMGKLLEGAPLPIAELMGKSPQDVQPKFGEPTGKGLVRESCLRFVPKRVWFGCKYVYQRYADISGKFEAVQVTYEDGAVTGLGFEGLKGEGEFSPKAALTFIGLELPGPGKETSPSENVKLWSWFNNSARLLIDGKQYRVSVSVVSGDWHSSKVEVILNDPLTDEQKAKVRTGAEEPDEASPEPKK